MYKKYFKRFFDVAFGILFLVVVMIPGIVIAVLIKLTSKGPVFFVQDRFGQHSKKFRIYKFRTMAVGTPSVANQDFTNIDSYITPIGKILRATSLDELPQIINILHGEMSFIGPRPLASTDIEVVEIRKTSGADQVRPGITGLAQVKGRNLITNEDKARFDFEYSTNVSLWLDVTIIFRTATSVILRSGINAQER
ncbi:sugar transferase [Weissella cibaria]|uniref:Sugar transferase n=1 Tax=Weissella cibaria TaxID=137591 RepID=A0A9Q8N9E4_9LACO|nr:sugar transferase [Weissella cibaria]TVV28272.1 sugar transferase [Weissella cibaria]TVV41465.1 sugar transferase [Weissella cibaria]